MINSTERSDILVFNCYLCHVRFLLACYVRSTKIGEISDISKCFENFVSQTLGFLTRNCAAELRNTKMKKILLLELMMAACTGLNAQIMFKTEYFGESDYRMTEGDTDRKVGNSKGSAVVYQGGVNIRCR